MMASTDVEWRIPFPYHPTLMLIPVLSGKDLDSIPLTIYLLWLEEEDVQWEVKPNNSPARITNTEFGQSRSTPHKINNHETRNDNDFPNNITTSTSSRPQG